jgi:hypothetical protein
MPKFIHHLSCNPRESKHHHCSTTSLRVLLREHVYMILFSMDHSGSIGNLSNKSIHLSHFDTLGCYSNAQHFDHHGTQHLVPIQTYPIDPCILARHNVRYVSSCINIMNHNHKLNHCNHCC